MIYRIHRLKVAFGLLLVAGCLTQSQQPSATLEAASQIQSELTLAPVSPPLPTAIPPHPLSIEALRSRSYPGSDFVVEETLEAGINYSRYIASYRSDELKIFALLTIPQAEAPPAGWPVLIFNHGYIPPDVYRTTERYVAYQDAFARSGYITVKSDYRGHGDSEGDPQSAYGSPAYTIDVLNALASARRLPNADPERVGMWGHSMGGYITLRAMVAQQDIRAGVIWAGVVDSYADLFSAWFGRRGSPFARTRSTWRSRLIEEHGSPVDNPDFWNTLSANAYLSELSGPVQLHHGTADADVPDSMSVRLDEQIRAAGQTAELFLYEGDDHNIASNRDDALAVSVAFFDRYVKQQ